MKKQALSTLDPATKKGRNTTMFRPFFVSSDSLHGKNPMTLQHLRAAYCSEGFSSFKLYQSTLRELYIITMRTRKMKILPAISA